MADSDDLLELGRKSDVHSMNQSVRDVGRYVTGQLKTRELAVRMAGNYYVLIQMHLISPMIKYI